MGNELYQVLIDPATKQYIRDQAKELGISQGEVLRRMAQQTGLPAGAQKEALQRLGVPTGSKPPPDEPNPQGCPTGIGAAAPCQLPNHGEAEWRVENELAPRLRRKIAPRDPVEGPHEYIARYWAADELKRDFYLDLNKGLGWIKDDDADTHEDYD